MANDENINQAKSPKPVSRINNEMVKHLDMNTKMPSVKGLRMVPTGGLALDLADKANTYSKIFYQLEA